MGRKWDSVNIVIYIFWRTYLFIWIDKCKSIALLERNALVILVKHTASRNRIWWVYKSCTTTIWFWILWKLTSERIHVIKVELWSRYYCSETNLSASPPVFRTTGIVPYRIAYICVQEFLWHRCQNSIKSGNPHFHYRLMVEQILIKYTSSYNSIVAYLSYLKNYSWRILTSWDHHDPKCLK